jgi:hypothetical protein
VKKIPDVAVPLASAALLIGLFAYYDLAVYQHYLLRGDEPAFITATLESPASWLTRGYLDYFNLYPEWETSNHSPLLKPVTNAVAYYDYLMFGRNYALYFAVFFAIQFLGLLVFVRLLRELAVPPLPAAAMALLFMVNPAFMNVGLTCLPCHFDVLAGVFAFSAFLALWREFYGVALLLLTLAVFTKESAIYAPVAAAASVLIWRRPPVLSALMTVPLLLWAAARFFVYGDVAENAFASPSSQIATGLAIWPTGLVSYGFARQVGSSFSSGLSRIVFAFFFVANIGLWAFLGYAGVAIARKQLDQPRPKDLTTALLVWTVGALSFGVLVGFNARYGGSIYPFLYLLLAALVFGSRIGLPVKLTVGALLVFSLVTLVQSVRTLRSALLWRSTIAPERALHDELAALPQDGRTVYVINAPPLFASAPRYLESAWSLNLHIVIINQFNGCITSSDAGATQFAAGRADLISVRIPDCAAFKFGAVPSRVFANAIGRPLEREGVGTYSFPVGVAASDRNAAIELGRTLTLKTQGEPTFIGYDWKKAGYRVVSAGN